MRIAFSPWPECASIKGLRELIPRVERAGLDGFWLPMGFGLDSITALAAIGPDIPRIELGTAVVAALPRHPVLLAQQALTAQAALGGRFTLGVGASHRAMMHDALGLPYRGLVSYMREYLTVLRAAMEGGNVHFTGRAFQVDVEVSVPGAKPASIFIGASGPAMLALAGELADGVITTLCGARTIEEHVTPVVTSAARQAARREPRIAVSLPIVVTHRPDDARAQLHRTIGSLDRLPAYQAVAAREGVAGVAGLGLVGDAKELDSQIARLESCGATDFLAMPIPVDDTAVDRAMEYLSSRL